MVTSIVPGAAGAGALGVDTRLTRTPGTASAPQQRREEVQVGDRVEVSGTAAWAAARESVRTGLAQVHQALAVGHDAQSMLLKVQALARGEGGGQAELDALLQGFMQRVDAATAGSAIVAGDSISVQAEPGAAPVQIGGADMRLKAEPQLRDVMKVALDASVDDAPALAAAAQRSLDALQAAMERLFEAARALEAHQGFLGAAEGAGQAATRDLDADSARLLALQVRQGLEAVGSAPIANVEPQAVLTLFRA